MLRAPLGSAVILALTLGVAVPGCAERTVDDDVRTVCVDYCERGRRCNLDPADKSTQAECVQSCIPAFEDHREGCEASFGLLACLSKTTCVEQKEYANLVENGSFKDIYEGDYPCNEETVAELKICQGATYP